MHTGVKSIRRPVDRIDLLKFTGRAKACAAALTLVLCAVLAIAGCSMASGSEYADAKPLIAQEQDGQTGQSAPESLPRAEQGDSVAVQTALQRAAPEAPPLSAQMPAEPSSVSELLPEQVLSPESPQEPSPVPDPLQPAKISPAEKPLTEELLAETSSTEIQPTEIPLAEMAPTEIPPAEMPSPDMEIPDEAQEEEDDDGLLFIDIFEDLVPGEGIIPVPSVIGKMWDDAKSELESSGFIVEPVEVYSDTAAIGTIVNQHPFPFFQQRGSLIELDVSIGVKSSESQDSILYD